MREVDAGSEARPSILLVDDDEFILDSVGAMVRFLGFDAILAMTGEEALARLSEGLQPDLVILDMDMPGLGGAGTLPQLRALRPCLPVVIATGRVNGIVMELMRSYSGVGLLPKPFDLGDLRKHLA